MKKILMGLVVSLLVSGGALAQNLSKSIVGTYDGVYYIGSSTLTSIKLVIDSMNERGELTGKLFAQQSSCSGEFAAKGTINGQLVEIATSPRESSSEKCGGRKFTLNIDGDKLTGHMLGANGRTYTVSFSK